MFLVANDKSILQHDNIQKRKWKNLFTISSNNIFSDYHNPERVIFNLSSYELTDDKKNVLCKDLDFSVKPGLIEYSEFLLPFELFSGDMKNENLCNEDMSFVQKRGYVQNIYSDPEPPKNLIPSEYKVYVYQKTKTLSFRKQIKVTLL